MIAALPSIVSRLRLKQLRLLIALDEQGSVHRAAEQVFISQPGATKSLHEIENTFGAELFTRNSQGLVPNDLGRCVIRYARLIHSDVAHLREEMVGILQGHGGRLSVGTIMGAVPMLMRALGRLRRKQPELSVEIVEDTSARLLGLVDQGRLDLAICRSSVSQRPDAYDCLTLHPEQLTVVAHPDHPARVATLELADLSIYRWVVYPANMPMRLLLEREFSQCGLEFPRYPVETASTFTMLSLLQEDSELVAVMPLAVAEFSERFGMIRRLPLNLQSRSEPYGVIARHGSTLSAAAQLLLEELQTEQLSV
ncbi:LysR family transcriptional regulator [Stutzerimonas zhaodongensis]|jgi:DNA-binding transcriptional LysR family regulator|uniref:LysR family transcriptional regulator n=1 Tax=Stutzerimonas zhaodongensis TaxID=1176257 RepID=A0A365PUR5_9GAMM|nr:LysR family transcriptional regulator [Stutzerimonas zhaodongensis]QWV16280.1 LysR family transcriptional regulator [Stutzerimonas zhaodongensis]RBA57520.1 LysR family transcriptional regulator [Stutzerimonas zhaodongensis]